MHWVEKAFLSAQLVAFALVLVALVYLVLRRIRIKKEEKFEKRDN